MSEFTGMRWLMDNAALVRAPRADTERWMAEGLMRQSERLQQLALESGAMPGDFQIVHVYKAWPAEVRLTTELR